MATNKPQDDYQKQGMRIPRELHARIHEAAAASGRSYNSEVIYQLERNLGPTAASHDATLSTVPTADLLAELGRRCER